MDSVKQVSHPISIHGPGVGYEIVKKLARRVAGLLAAAGRNLGLVERAGSAHYRVARLCSKPKQGKDKRPLARMYVICVSYVLRNGFMYANVCHICKHKSHTPAKRTPPCPLTSPVRWRRGK